MKKNCENQLDEMQEQKLLHLEHNMAWLAFWGLLGAILVQLVLKPGDMGGILGEWIVVMALCLYLVAGCFKNGIWDRKLKPEPKTNFLAGLFAGALTGGVFGLIAYRNTGLLSRGLVWFGGVGAGMTVLCWLLLTITAKLYKKRVSQLEDAPEGDA